MTYLQQLWQKRNIRVVIALSVLPISFAAYAVALGDDTASQQYQAQRVSEKLPAIQLKAAQPSASYWRDEIVQAGDNLSAVLGRFGISERHIQNILRESPIDTKLLQLRPNQVISMKMDTKGNPTNVQFFNDDDNGEKNLIALEFKDNRWQAQVGAVETQTMPTLKAVLVKSSFTGSMAQAGIPVEIREALKEIFSDSLDLTQLARGDTVRVLYDSLYFRGQELSTGDIRSVEISHDGKLYRAYYFGENGEGQYYDANGKPMRKGFDVQPVAFTRISSPFGMRYHPVLHTLKMHTGIDYAAPTGTPIHAPSGGLVTFRGWKGGYGNAIVIQHNASMETIYGHMSAFTPNVQAGSNVKAGDIIGFVGSTGRSTGPHLHYEVRLNGQPVNPTTVALPSKQLTSQELVQFRKEQQQLEAMLSPLRDLKLTIAQLD